jgi:nucleoside 2-deoxyribosyltransferase
VSAQTGLARVYVAGATREVGRVRAVQGYVRSAGYAVTYDWTEGLEAQTVAECDMPDEQARAIAWRCLDGVADADVIVLCAPKYVPTRGAWAELGYAVALKRGIVVLGEGNRVSIFTRLGHVFLRDDVQVAEGIVEALAYRGK